MRASFLSQPSNIPSFRPSARVRYDSGMNASKLQQILLVETAYHQRELAAVDASEMDPFELDDHEDQIEHGPRYQPGEWFGQLSDVHQTRLRRTIRKLEADGLLTTWKQFGGRLSHIKLTDAGMAEAERIQQPEASLVSG